MKKYLSIGILCLLLLVLILCVTTGITSEKKVDNDIRRDFFDEMRKVVSVDITYGDVHTGDLHMADLFLEGSGVDEVSADDMTDFDGDTGRQDYVCRFYDADGNVLYHMQYYSDVKTVDSLNVLVLKNPNTEESEAWYKITNPELIADLLQYVDEFVE